MELDHAIKDLLIFNLLISYIHIIFNLLISSIGRTLRIIHTLQYNLMAAPKSVLAFKKDVIGEPYST